MSIQLEAISIIIPIHILKKYYLFYLDFQQSIKDGFVQCNEHLVRIVAMNPIDIECNVSDFKSKGLKQLKISNKVKHWNEFCVVDSFQEPTLPCDWLTWDQEKHCVFYNT